MNAGQYKITDEITVNKNSVVFRGAGRQGGLYSDDTRQFGSMLFFGEDWTLNDPSGIKSLLRFAKVDDLDQGKTSHAWGCGVHSISICQYPRTRAYPCGAAIYVESGIAFTMENCTFDWIPGSALKIAACSLSQFTNVKVKRCGRARMLKGDLPAVFLLDGGSQGYVQGSVFTGFKVEACYEAPYFYVGDKNVANKFDDLGFEADPKVFGTGQTFLQVRGDRNHFGKLHFNRHPHYTEHVKLSVEASDCHFGELTFAGRSSAQGSLAVTESATDNQFGSVLIAATIPRSLDKTSADWSEQDHLLVSGERNQFGKVICTQYQDRGHIGRLSIHGTRNQVGQLIDTGSQGIVLGGFQNKLVSCISKDCPNTALVVTGHRADILQALVEDCSVEGEPVVRFASPLADDLARGWSSESRASIRVVGADDASEGILVLSGDVELLPGTQVRGVRLGHGIRWCGVRGSWNGVEVVDVGQDGFFVDGGSPTSMASWVARQCNTTNKEFGGFRATAPSTTPERASCVGFLVREEGSSHDYSFKLVAGGTASSSTDRWQIQGNVAAGGPISLPTSMRHGVDVDSEGLGDAITVEATTVTLPDSANVFKVGPDASPVQLDTITASWPGRRITFVFTGIQTVADNTGNLKLQGGSGPFLSTADDTLTLVCDGTDWFEVCRSVN